MKVFAFVLFTFLTFSSISEEEAPGAEDPDAEESMEDLKQKCEELYGDCLVANALDYLARRQAINDLYDELIGLCDEGYKRCRASARFFSWVRWFPGWGRIVPPLIRVSCEGLRDGCYASAKRWKTRALAKLDGENFQGMIDCIGLRNTCLNGDES